MTTDSLIGLLKESAQLLSEIPAPYSYGLWERMCDLGKRIETVLGDASTRKDGSANEAEVSSEEAVAAILKAAREKVAPIVAQEREAEKIPQGLMEFRVGDALNPESPVTQMQEKQHV